MLKIKLTESKLRQLIREEVQISDKFYRGVISFVSSALKRKRFKSSYDAALGLLRVVDKNFNTDLEKNQKAGANEVKSYSESPQFIEIYGYKDISEDDPNYDFNDGEHVFLGGDMESMYKVNVKSGDVTEK
jgi:hypothetical protein